MQELFCPGNKLSVQGLTTEMHAKFLSDQPLLSINFRIPQGFTTTVCLY